MDLLCGVKLCDGRSKEGKYLLYLYCLMWWLLPFRLCLIYATRFRALLMTVVSSLIVLSKWSCLWNNFLFLLKFHTTFFSGCKNVPVSLISLPVKENGTIINLVTLILFIIDQVQWNTGFSVRTLSFALWGLRVLDLEFHRRLDLTSHKHQLLFSSASLTFSLDAP